jgi:hypothetical protein
MTFGQVWIPLLICRVSGRFRREDLGLSFSENHLSGNLLHLQVYVNLLKLVQILPMKVDGNYISKLPHGLIREGSIAFMVVSYSVKTFKKLSV